MSQDVVVPLGGKLLRQCRKPEGWIGRLVLRNMNRSHSRLTDWALSHVVIRSDDTILDIGCGGGKTTAKLAVLAPDGKVYGVDFSEESVAVSRAFNKALVSAGRVEILHAGVSELPFSDSMFDVVTAVETHYYWPNLAADVREVLRVMKPGGTFAMIAEAYKGGKHDRVLRRLETLQRRGIMSFTLLSANEHRDLLTTGGYSDVNVFENYDKGWICAVGRKS